MFKHLTCILALGLAWPAMAHAQFATDEPTSDLSLLVFVGESVRGFQSYPFDSTDGDQDHIGAALAWTPVDLPLGFRAGLDGGLSYRDDGNQFGPSGTSVEGWFGPTLRHEGVELGPVRLSAGLTVGFSAVTESNGLERAREIEEDGNAAFIYYASPEIGLSLTSAPKFELVYRLHHRSGASQVSSLPTLGSIGDTTNAQLLGLRYKF